MINEAYNDSDNLYHGTASVKHALQIVSSRRLKPGNIDKSHARGFIPMKNKVYLTASLHQALAYVWGFHPNYINKGGTFTDLLKKDIRDKKQDRYGFLFVVSKQDLYDVTVDEDMIADILEDNSLATQFRWLHDLARKNSPRTYQNLLHRGDYEYGVVIGKRIVNKLTTKQQEQILSVKDNIGHVGDVEFKEAWMVDKLRGPELNDNSTNFFQIAKRIK